MADFTASESVNIPPSRRGLLSRAKFIGAPALLWGAYAITIFGYAALRGIGDSLLPWLDGERVERTLLLGFEPTRALQGQIYGGGSRWFDFFGFLLHASWFFLPFGFGLIITVFERKRLFEYLGWIVAAGYLSDIGYLLFPMRPPWMEPGIRRILLDRSFVEYTKLDDNPVASLPSLHAGIPLVIALFLLLRCERTRQAGWIAAAFAGLVGFFLVYLGEHWTIDVFAGYALAGLVAVLFMHPRLHALYDRLPFQPRQKLIALNEWLSARDAPLVQLQPSDLALEQPEAA